MAPSATTQDTVESISVTKDNREVTRKPEGRRYLIDRSLNELPFEVIGSKGNYLHFASGQKVFDATCGAAVACLGHGNQEVKEAIMEQLDVNTYCNSMLFTTPASGKLAEQIIQGTGNLMSKVYICCSGSEATEAAMKMARQYFQDISPPQPQRTKYIAREHSYHGNTLGALSLSGHVARRDAYTPILSTNVSWVSSCNPYRQRLPLESDALFVARKAAELDAEFVRLGPSTVIAFVCEPISGAALGCIPPVPGYLAALKTVCRAHGALFILDEIMAGMGRAGTLHAWQADHDPAGARGPPRDCLPDLQMVGKGLGGGYQAVAAVIAGDRFVRAIQDGPTGGLVHGQTYQALPIACAAALAVQRIIARDGLLANARAQGAHLAALLRARLGAHAHVGDVRGRGLFWALEFVQDRATKEPFPRAWNVAGRVSETALREPFSITFYPGQGTVDGWRGDHVIVAPAYNVTRAEVEYIVEQMVGVVGAVFAQLVKEGKSGVCV